MDQYCVVRDVRAAEKPTAGDEKAHNYYQSLVAGSQVMCAQGSEPTDDMVSSKATSFIIQDAQALLEAANSALSKSAAGMGQRIVQPQ